MKILLDMNLSMAWLPLLQGAGHDVAHWSSLGPVDAGDDEILAFAQDHQFVIFTHDLDFGTLIVEGGHTAPSVIQLRSDDLMPRTVGDVVLRTLRLAHRDLEDGAIVTIDAARVRLRILPIKPDR